MCSGDSGLVGDNNALRPFGTMGNNKYRCIISVPAIWSKLATELVGGDVAPAWILLILARK